LFEHERDHWRDPDRRSNVAYDGVPNIPAHADFSTRLREIPNRSFTHSRSLFTETGGAELADREIKAQGWKASVRTLAKYEKRTMTQIIIRTKSGGHHKQKLIRIPNEQPLAIPNEKLEPSLNNCERPET
jgi:hypothetical protein